MSRHENVVQVLSDLQQRIISIESGQPELSETDTRQGLINPLFRALGWDFGDFDSVKSEVRHKSFNEPVDYAFYSSQDKSCPILLLEAKRFGTNLSSKKIKKADHFLRNFLRRNTVLSARRLNFESQELLVIE